MDRPKRRTNKRIWGVAIISLLLAAIVFLIFKKEEFIFIPMAPFFQVLFTLIGVAIGICWAIRTTNVHQLWTAEGNIVETVHLGHLRITEKWARTFKEYQYTSRFLSHLTSYFIYGLLILLIPLFCELLGRHFDFGAWWIALLFVIYLIPIAVYLVKYVEQSSSSNGPPVPKHPCILDRMCPPILNVEDLYERPDLKNLRTEYEWLKQFLNESNVSYSSKKA